MPTGGTSSASREATRAGETGRLHDPGHRRRRQRAGHRLRTRENQRVVAVVTAQRPHRAEQRHDRRNQRRHLLAVPLHPAGRDTLLERVLGNLSPPRKPGFGRACRRQDLEPQARLRRPRRAARVDPLHRLSRPAGGRPPPPRQGARESAGHHGPRRWPTPSRASDGRAAVRIWNRRHAFADRVARHVSIRCIAVPAGRRLAPAPRVKAPANQPGITAPDGGRRRD